MNSIIDLDLLKVHLYVYTIYTLKAVSPHCWPLFTFGVKKRILFEGRRPLLCVVFRSIRDLLVLSESKLPHHTDSVSTVTTKNVCKFCQMVPGRQIALSKITIAVNLAK